MTPAARIRVNGADLIPGDPVVTVDGDTAVMLWAIRSHHTRTLHDDKRDAARYFEAELAGRGYALTGEVRHDVHHGKFPWGQSRVQVKPRVARVVAR